MMQLKQLFKESSDDEKVLIDVKTSIVWMS